MHSLHDGNTPGHPNIRGVRMHPILSGRRNAAISHFPLNGGGRFLMQRNLRNVVILHKYGIRALPDKMQKLEFAKISRNEDWHDFERGEGLFCTQNSVRKQLHRFRYAPHDSAFLLGTNPANVDDYVKVVIRLSNCRNKIFISPNQTNVPIRI